jgi:hypothetical protein
MNALPLRDLLSRTADVPCYTAAKAVMLMKRMLIIVLVALLVASTGCVPTVLRSDQGNVEVTAPRRNDTVTFTQQADGSWYADVNAKGKARAFEAGVNWEAFQQLSSDSLVDLGSGYFMADGGAPDFGPFDTNLHLVSSAENPAPEGEGIIRIFLTSMKDGSQLDIVDVKVKLTTAP